MVSSIEIRYVIHSGRIQLAGVIGFSVSFLAIHHLRWIYMFAWDAGRFITLRSFGCNGPLSSSTWTVTVGNWHGGSVRVDPLLFLFDICFCRLAHILDRRLIS